MLEKLFYDVLEMTISASLVIAIVVWLFPYIDKKYNIKWRKIFWLLLGIRLLIPYNFSLPNTPIRLFHITREIAQKDGSNLPLAFLLAFIWGIGVVLYLRIQYLNYKHFKTEMLENAERIAAPEILSLLREIKEELLLKKEIVLMYQERIKTPTVIGIKKPILLLPKETYPIKNLELILIHECMHIDNKDIIYKIVMSTVAAVHWFNPLVHKMVTLSFRDIELVCDRCVVEEMNLEQRGFYGETILDSVKKEKQRDIAYSTCFFGSDNIMKQRIDHIFDRETKKNGTLLFVGILVCYLMISLFISCG